MAPSKQTSTAISGSLGNPAILQDPVRWRGMAPREPGQPPSRDEVAIRFLMREMFLADVESTFHRNFNLTLDPQTGHKALLWCGQTQLGKTRETLQMVWLSIFKYE